VTSVLAHAQFFVTVISSVAVMCIGILFALSHNRAGCCRLPNAEWRKDAQS